MLHIVRSIVVVALLATVSRSAGAANSPRRGAAADSLLHHARALITGGGAAGKIKAIDELDEASQLAPDRAEIWRELAQVCMSAGRQEQSRRCLGRLEKLEPDDAEAHRFLGMSWKWDWLSSFEPGSYVRAVQELQAAARLDAADLESRVALTALGIAAGKLDLANRASLSAMLAAPDSPEAVLAIACVAYRMGELARADSAFNEAIGALPRDVAAHFKDLSAIGVETRASSADWEGLDPDLTTPQNEIELDFMARVGEALLLFRDQNGAQHWDMRTELVVRYGLPSRVEVNSRSLYMEEEFAYLRLKPVYYAPDPLPYPYTVQVWHYPELGIMVDLWDQSLSQNFKLPIVYQTDPDPLPNPALLAGRTDLVSIGGGRGIYRALPPGITPMPARGMVARFPAAEGARLVANLEVPGGPLDSLSGSWAVETLDGRVVARESQALAISSCDPTRRRIAQFAVIVPPGDYRIDLAVEDRDGHRGVVHEHEIVGSPPAGLSLSDLVVLCDSRLPADADNAVRIEPDFEQRVGHARLVVYFEANGLAADTRGDSRFSYRYTVRPIEDKKRKRGHEPVIDDTREEENVGPLRRQFLTVPVTALKPGAFEIAVEIRDLVSGATATAATRFVKD
jgi:Flp pilus assembly protein TadD